MAESPTLTASEPPPRARTWRDVVEVDLGALFFTHAERVALVCTGAALVAALVAACAALK